jgi:hypothetical protein
MYELDDVETPINLYTQHVKGLYDTLQDEGEITLKDIIKLIDLGFKYINELNEANLQLNIENGKLIAKLNKEKK